MNWQEEYDKRRIELIRLKQKYYGFEGRLELPHAGRYYFDGLSSEFKRLPMPEKLADLSFLLSQGFDLQQSVTDYKTDRAAYIIDEIARTFRQYICYMRWGEHTHFTDEVLEDMTESELIALFAAEIVIRYDEHEHAVRTADWNEDKLLDACKDKEMFERLVKTTEWSEKLI